ncbi:MAG: hypothetical protein R2746_11520 [Acidimicrobiales bacterium]
MSDEVGRRVVRVLPDVAAIDKEFDYVVPEGVAVHLGDVVRIDLHGRRVGGWITALDVHPPEGVALRRLARVSGRGPAAELHDLAAWAAWRWAGRRATFLRSASPPAVVRSLPAPAREARPNQPGPDPDPGVAEALDLPVAVLRWPPAADRYGLVRAAVAAPSPVPGGRTLVLCPSVAEARPGWSVAPRWCAHRRGRPGRRRRGCGGGVGTSPRRRGGGGRSGGGVGARGTARSGGGARRARRGLPGGEQPHLARPGRGGGASAAPARRACSCRPRRRSRP